MASTADNRNSQPTLANEFIRNSRRADASVDVESGAGTDRPVAVLEPVVQQPAEQPADSARRQSFVIGLLPDWRWTLLALVAYALVIFVCAIVAIFVQLQVGLFLLSSAPSVMFVSYLVHRFAMTIDTCQLSLTTLWAIALMLPLIIFHWISLLLGVWEPVYSLSAFVRPLIVAYIQAGFLEELLKYNAIRAILNKDLVADPRALLVYACGAANGFALVENFLYVFGSGTGGVLTGILRAFLSVPAHTAWGMVSGGALAARKFLGVKNNWYTIIPIPMFLHGTYNFSLFVLELLPEGTNPAWYWVLTFVSVGVTIGSWVYVVIRSKRFEGVPTVQVKTLQRAGLLPRATVGSCVQDCALCWCCVANKPARGRQRTASGLQELNRVYTRQLVAAPGEAGAQGPSSGRSDTDLQGTAVPNSAAPAIAGPGPEAAGPPRLMQIVVPDNYQAGNRLRVVGPVDKQVYLIDVPIGIRPGATLIVPY